MKKEEKETFKKIKQLVKNGNIDDAVFYAKKLWGEKGERVIYSDNKHSVDIIYRYRWGYWKGMLQKYILTNFKDER